MDTEKIIDEVQTHIGPLIDVVTAYTVQHDISLPAGTMMLGMMFVAGCLEARMPQAVRNQVFVDLDAHINRLEKANEQSSRH